MLLAIGAPLMGIVFGLFISMGQDNRRKAVDITALGSCGLELGLATAHVSLLVAIIVTIPLLGAMWIVSGDKSWNAMARLVSRTRRSRGE